MPGKATIRFVLEKWCDAFCVVYIGRLLLYRKKWAINFLRVTKPMVGLSKDILTLQAKQLRVGMFSQSGKKAKIVALAMDDRVNKHIDSEIKRLLRRDYLEKDKLKLTVIGADGKERVVAY